MPQPGTAIPKRFDMKFVKFSLRHQILLLPALLLLLYVYGIGYFVAYAAAVVLATPVLLHLTYPTLFRPSITTDLQKPLGLSLVIGASLVAALIQSCPRGRENATIMRVMVLIELLHNGSPAEKEQVTSYLRWIKRAGLSDSRTAEIIETVTWMLLEFDARFGYCVSARRRDAIVMQCSCVGMRVGVPSDLLTTDHESFQARLSSLSDWQGTIQQDELDLQSLRASSLWQKLALFMAEDLLPPHLRGNGECTRSHFSGRNLLRSSVHMFLWLAFPVLSCIPLRTIIGFITVVHDDSRHVVNAILDDLLTMDVEENLPLKPQTVGDREPSYISWLEDEAQDVPLLNSILKSTLNTQAQCSVFNVFSWVSLFFSIFYTSLHRAVDVALSIPQFLTVQRQQRIMLTTETFKSPQHVGLIMDGNRRYARQLGRTVLFGHNRGARKAADVRAYWMQTATCTDDNLPQAMTVWAFSSDNHKRSVEEVHGLFKILSSEFMDMAYCPLIHLFQIRVRIIGSKERLPNALLNAIDILERSTEHYSKFYYQIAVGYGGKLEVVEAVKEITAKGEDVTEKAVEAHTICAKIGVPPVDLIVRTSERRTSGFFLWGTQSAELHFIDKLWPLLTAKDWYDSLLEFNTREVRNGI